MPHRLSRRRAVARTLTALAGFALVSSIAPPRTFAQVPNLPGDVPPSGSQPTDPPSPPAVEPVDPLGAAPDDTQPADETPPVTASTGPWGIQPVKLTIPALGVEAPVEAVGVDPDGAMSVPTDPDGVAWYQLGPGMGVPGNAVFAAHVNWDGRLRPFGLLHQLGEGDAIQIIDAEGRGFEYVVESSHWVRAEGAPLADIFAQPNEPVVTLITCGGEYIAATREYLDRLIVKARGA